MINNFTFEEFISIKRKYGNRCLRCGKSESEVELTPDHVIPLTSGGPNWIWNIQPLCRSCNASKRDKHVDYRTKAIVLYGSI